MKQDRISDALLPCSGAPAPRLGQALLWKPRFVREDEILWHVPFLFWLVDALRPRTYVELGAGEGVSFMAVCQALHRLHANGQAFAVGDWPDEDAIPEALSTRNADLYEDFSHLLTGGYEKAAEEIEDGSVELMLVNAARAPKLSRLVSKRWLEKLGRSGVLLLNGVDCGDEDLKKLAAELSETSPTMHLPGGNGLLVVLPSDAGDELANIGALSPDDPAQKLIIQMFTRLGAGSFYEAHAGSEHRRLKEADEKIRWSREQRNNLAARLEEREKQYDARHRKVAILESRCFDLEVALGVLSADADSLRERLAATEADCVAKQAAHEALEAQQERLSELLVKERTQRAAAERSLEQSVESRRELKEELKARPSVEEMSAERERMQGLLDEERTARTVAEHSLDQERTERVRAEQRLAQSTEHCYRLEEKLAKLTPQSANHYRALKSLTELLEQNENLVTALGAELKGRTEAGQANDAGIEKAQSEVTGVSGS